MSDIGYYFLDYRVWWDKGVLRLQCGDAVVPIPQEDIAQIVEMLVRASNDKKRTADGRVRNTNGNG